MKENGLLFDMDMCIGIVCSWLCCLLLCWFVAYVGVNSRRHHLPYIKIGLKAL